jgi:hypothetical protein
MPKASPNQTISSVAVRHYNALCHYASSRMIGHKDQVWISMLHTFEWVTAAMFQSGSLLDLSHLRLSLALGGHRQCPSSFHAQLKPHRTHMTISPCPAASSNVGSQTKVSTRCQRCLPEVSRRRPDTQELYIGHGLVALAQLAHLPLKLYSFKFVQLLDFLWVLVLFQITSSW